MLVLRRLLVMDLLWRCWGCMLRRYRCSCTLILHNRDRTYTGQPDHAWLSLSHTCYAARLVLGKRNVVKPGTASGPSRLQVSLLALVNITCWTLQDTA